MRILLVSDWTANEGGIETYVSRLSPALKAAGHEVRLLTGSAGSAGADAADYVAFGTDNPAGKTVLQIVNPFAVRRVREAVRDFRPHVVQVNMFEQYLSPAIFHALRGVPTLAMVHYTKPICPTALKLLPDGSLCEFPAGIVCWRSGCIGLAEWVRDRPRTALTRSGLLHAARTLACSRWMAEQLRVNGIPAEAIPLPVPPPGVGFRRVPSPYPLFLYCGRLNWEKGTDLLLRAFGRVLARRPEAQLRILGDGPRRPALEDLARGLGIHGSVSFQGRVAFGEVEAALQEAWVLVAPSIWPEPLGLTAIEAITRGVPAVATASGGFAETIADGKSGFLVPNGDEEALAECLIRVADGAPATVPDELARSLQDRHHPARHAVLLTRVFEAILDAPAAGHD